MRPLWVGLGWSWAIRGWVVMHGDVKPWRATGLLAAIDAITRCGCRRCNACQIDPTTWMDTARTGENSELKILAGWALLVKRIGFEEFAYRDIVLPEEQR